MTKVCVADPREFQPMEVDDFVAFVIAGGQVTPHGLRDRVMRASHIAFLRENECLLGVGGLKWPSADYREGIERSARTELPTEDFPFELGWVFILPSARGRKLSFLICHPLVTAALGRGVFATSLSGKKGMHRTLEKLEFTRAGLKWPSQENDDNLELFLRHAT